MYQTNKNKELDMILIMLKFTSPYTNLDYYNPVWDEESQNFTYKRQFFFNKSMIQQK